MNESRKQRGWKEKGKKKKRKGLLIQQPKTTKGSKEYYKGDKNLRDKVAGGKMVLG